MAEKQHVGKCKNVRSVLVAAPNLALDRIARLSELRTGEVLRFREARVGAGGKGVNVCRAARLLGRPATLVGLLPGLTGEAVARMLAGEGIELVGVPCSGEVRAATIVLEDSGRVTVLNEPGPRLSEAEWETYERAVREQDASAFLICSGSVPPGAPDDAFARLVKDRPALVDATGELLARALESEPEWVTPNVSEAEEALSGKAWHATAAGHDAERRAGAAAAELIRRGARNAAVTAGAAGVAVAGAEGAYFVRAPWVTARNPIGAGDCFAAALVAGLESARTAPDAIRAAVAVAAASVESETPGHFDPGRARNLERELEAVG
jgi:1-phosphofructokinase family hexose kinase